MVGAAVQILAPCLLRVWKHVLCPSWCSFKRRRFPAQSKFSVNSVGLTKSKGKELGTKWGYHVYFASGHRQVGTHRLSQPCSFLSPLTRRSSVDGSPVTGRCLTNYIPGTEGRENGCFLSTPPLGQHSHD